MAKEHLHNNLIQPFIELIGVQTGLHIREQDRENLLQKIGVRMKARKLSLAEMYYQLLKSDTYESHLEWQELSLLLTTGESYLFRDRGQFYLLRTKILPELIEKHRWMRSLRIWSAGCSTGEEPYSLAILIKELIPDWENWHIFILGTDINQEAINKAKQGIYSSWSFRLVDAKIKKQYFHPLRENWQINEQIRQMVTFKHGNLLKDTVYANNLDAYNIDLIICRNVFVYFEHKAIASVLQKFYNALRPGGYLMTGHAEIQGQDLGLLKTKIFPESLLYQRHDNEEVTSQTDLEGANNKKKQQEKGNITPFDPPISLQQVVEPINRLKTQPLSLANTEPREKSLDKISIQMILQEAQTLFKKEDYNLALKKAEQVLELQPQHFNAYCLIAQVYANLGDYNQANQYCHLALTVNSFAIEPYYLLGHIAEEQENLSEAKSFFKKVIYLAPTSISAYLHLSYIYESEGDSARSQRMLKSAFQILKDLPPDLTVENQGELRAGELIIEIKKLLKNNT